ncbi:small s [Fusarium albosuccineum]|uniref:Small s n=1 Tax=Fusarium albosuccineum TaxID=1237068 RepID=A0A8H4P4U0_9HYPO|nr:small s [Fusarium albosuccineum]
MDPLSLLGVTATIVQSIGVAFKAATVIRQYAGETQSVDLDMPLDELALTLDHLRHAKVIENSEFAELARDAYGLAKDLLDMNAKLIKSRHAPLWTLPVQRARAASSRRQIDARIEELLELQRKIERILLTRLSRVREDDVHKIQESHDFKELDAYGKAAVTALLGQYLDQKNDGDAARCFTSAGRLMNHIQGSAGAGNIQDDGSPLNHARAAEDERRVSADGALLELLQYRLMENRKAMITKPFESSCQWVYKKPVDGKWKSLPDWLDCGSGVYLIVGNEASGKSTMMKYISTREKTLEGLRKWAHDQPLVTAAFFFWRNGTQLEKSEEGLWRSLLYSVLDQLPQLMPIVFPREWALLYSTAGGEDSMLSEGLGAWEVETLQRAFHRLVTQDQMPLKLFILIDGIDEYQNDGSSDDFGKIVGFIKEEIASSENVKALVSSRPLEAFDRSGLQPSLTLHELNHDDIEVYVRSVLEEDNRFLANRDADSEKAEPLIRYILSASKGVFLWAVLSVRTVGGKLAEGKSLDEITASLQREFILALADLYRLIWEGMEDTTTMQAAQILQIMLAGKEVKRSWLDNDEEGLRLIDLALGLGDPEETIEAHVVPWHIVKPDVQGKCNAIANGFMKTWPGFITTANVGEGERNWNPSSRIRYCHRSVPEFFSERYASLLRTATLNLSFQFCPRIAHLKAAVHQLKVLPKPLLDEPLRVLWAIATTALMAANRIDTGNPFSPGGAGDLDVLYALDTHKYHALLVELDRTMEHHHKILQQDAENNYLQTVLQDHRGTVIIHDRGRDSRLKAAMHWSNFHSDPAYAHPRSWNDSFLSLTIEFGLHNYVKSRLGSGNSSKVLKAKKGRPLLDYALRPSLPLHVAPHTLVAPDVVKTLLDHGARPNEKFEGRTCWEGALQWQYDVFAVGEGRAVFEMGGTTEDARRVADSRVEVFTMLLDKGADVLASIVTAKGNKISARRVLEVSLKGWVTNEDIVQALLERFPEDKTDRLGSFRVFGD